MYYAKEHTRINIELYKKEHRCYVYALMLEAQCMMELPNLDQNDTLVVINESLKTMITLSKGKMLDPLLARLYEEKGFILKKLAGDDSKKFNDFNVQSLQCFNSSYALLV